MKWDDVRRQNPFYEARLAVKMTQEEIAAELDITAQYIYRIENGLINSPGSTIVNKYMEFLVEEFGVGIRDKLNIDAQWDSWVEAMRGLVAKALGSRPDKLLYGPYRDVNHLRDEHPFATFMFNLNETVGRFYGLSNAGYNLRSQQLFARLLCVHPRAVQQYMTPRISAEIPPVLEKALSDSGVERSTREALQREIALYSLRVWPI